MKILFVTTTLGTRGGIQRVTSVKANCYADMPGVEVAIAFTDRLGWPNNAIQPLSPKVKVFDLDSPFWDREPKRFDILWRFPQKALRLRQKLKGVIDEFAPDVVISTGQFEKYVLPLVKPFGRKFILVREYHFASNYRQIEQKVRYGKITFKPKLINWIENKLLSRFFDSNFLLTRQDLEENKLTGERFDYMWNPSSFDVNDSSVLESKEYVILAAGRLTKQKNFRSMIKIWAKTDRLDWKLRIIGEGEDKQQLIRLVQELGVTDSVEIVGFSSEVQEEMRRASIYVATSTFEGFMLVLVEAMSQGCVPISFRTSYGPEEIISDGINGYLTDMHDIDTFAKLLSELISNQELRHNMAQSALLRAHDFDVETICSQWMDKYNKLLSKI